MTDQPATPNFSIEMPPERAAGVFADFANVWHTDTSFVIDFMTITQPPLPGTDPQTGNPAVNVNAQVVSRVRIPPQQVFELARALTQQLTAWEAQSGVTPPSP